MAFSKLLARSNSVSLSVFPLFPRTLFAFAPATRRVRINEKLDLKTAPRLGYTILDNCAVSPRFEARKNVSPRPQKFLFYSLIPSQHSRSVE